MAGKNTAVFGIYPSRAALEDGLEALKDNDFRKEDISVLFPANEGNKDFAHERATKAPDGASAGAGTGAVIGGVLDWLAESARSQSPALGHLLLPVPSWQPSQASALVEPWVASPGV